MTFPLFSQRTLAAFLFAALGASVSTSAGATTPAASVIFDGTAPPNAMLQCSPVSSSIEAASLPGQPQAQCPSSSDTRIEDILVQSTALNDAAWVRLLLPPGYATSTHTWPVLFLLTGHGASYQSWTCDTYAEQYLANAGVLVVMPDGSRAYNRCSSPDTITSTTNAIPSFYSDWSSKSSDGSPEGWETFHMVELVQVLQAHYKAGKTFAVAGLSMGGLGSFAYAARHPGSFVAAASYSGFLNTVSTLGFGVENVSMLEANQDTNALWGYYPGTPGATFFGTQWPLHNPTQLASSLLGIPLYLSVGDGTVQALNPRAPIGEQAIEAGARTMANDFVSAMTSANHGESPANLKVDEYKGTHSWGYWDAEFCHSLPMLMSALGVPYTAPTCNALPL